MLIELIFYSALFTLQSIAVATVLSALLNIDVTREKWIEDVLLCVFCLVILSISMEWTLTDITNLLRIL